MCALFAETVTIITIRLEARTEFVNEGVRQRVVSSSYRDLHVTLGPWLVNGGPEWLSRYNDSQRSGTVRGSNPGGGRRDFPHPSRQALGPTQLPVQRVLDVFPGGKAAGAWRCYTPHRRG